MRASSQQAALAALLLLAAELSGLALLGWSVVSIQQTRAFVERCWPTQGSVIAFARSAQGVESAGAQPVVGYFTPNGGTLEFRPRLLLPWNGLTVGDKITVLYDPLAPEDARLDLFEQLWLIPAVIAALGALLVIGPAVAWAAGLFRPRSTNA
jgi:hypothetical protein